MKRAGEAVGLAFYGVAARFDAATPIEGFGCTQPHLGKVA